MKLWIRNHQSATDAFFLFFFSPFFGGASAGVRDEEGLGTKFFPGALILEDRLRVDGTRLILLVFTNVRRHRTCFLDGIDKSYISKKKIENKYGSLHTSSLHGPNSWV